MSQRGRGIPARGGGVPSRGGVPRPRGGGASIAGIQIGGGPTPGRGASIASAAGRGGIPSRSTTPTTDAARRGTPPVGRGTARGGVPPRTGGGKNHSGAGANSLLGGSMIVGLDGVRQRDTSGRIVEWSSPDDKCTQCMTDRYLNPKLRLLVGPCFHKMCESCIDRIFLLGPAPCPTCGTIVRKNEFASQTFEDLDVEREVVLRQQISKICFRSLDDFGGDLGAYNDYLDKVESVTYNLVNHIDEEDARAWIEGQKAASRGGVGAHERSAMRETELSQQIDAMQREERLAKRVRLVALDEREKADKDAEAKEAVRLLEQGLISPAEVHQRQAAAAQRRRLERERDEAAVEQEFAERAEHKLASLIGAANASNKKNKKGSGTQSEHARLWGARGFKPEMLMDLSGPLASVHDARSWLPPLAPYAGTPPPPSKARSDPDVQLATLWSTTHPRTAHPLAMGGNQSNDGNAFSLDQLVRMRAGGYNWNDTIQSEHQAGMATVGYMTPEVQQLLREINPS